MKQIENPIKTALISVSDKTGIVPFAQTLAQLGIEILSTGGTARHLTEAGITVRDVSDVTGFPEMMAGRVKTLHPKIHGGILARRNIDQAEIQQHGISPIDLVVVNLYPFNKVISGNHTDADAIENIDIGGPCMLRAAAKNHTWVTVICDPADYPAAQQALQDHQTSIPLTMRRQYAQKAFSHTAAYDASISQYFRQNQAQETVTFPQQFTPSFNKQLDCRYGENPHQQAAVYTASTCQPGDGQLAGAIAHQGKALSYNNFNDADAAWLCVNQFQQQPACVIVKHANPCGVAVNADPLQAYQQAYACDPTSAFGGIIAFNCELDEKTATAIIQQQFVEVILAPSIAAAALPVLATKPNVRALSVGRFDPQKQQNELQMTTISGGLLVQSRDWLPLTAAQCQVVSERQPTEQQIKDCLFAWHVCQFVKSNAIIYAKDNRTLGIGAGQMSRVFSARIARDKAAEAELRLDGAAMASDAFFPFRDSIDEAAKIGIGAVIQPGGSKRDQEVIDAVNEAGMVMLLTGVRHFRH